MSFSRTTELKSECIASSSSAVIEVYSINKEFKLDAEALAYAKKLGDLFDPYFPPVKDEKNNWHIGGQCSHFAAKMMMGSVNLGNRIFTNDTVALTGKGQCKITPASNFYAQQPKLAILRFFSQSAANASTKSTTVKAKIDGVDYEGDEIIVDYQADKISVINPVARMQNRLER
jgi:hypothetical protein